MNLYNFESYIDNKILARGYDYYENDNVISIKEINEKVYKAKVEGTELYTVEVELDEDQNILDTQCNCPYDMGEFCKHQTAVFLALRDMKKNSIADDLGTEPLIKNKMLKERKESGIKKTLAKRTREELIEFLLEISSEYKEIKQRINLKFNEGNDEDEISKAIALISAYIDKNSGDFGYISYGYADEALKGAYLVLEKAGIAIRQDRKVHALDLVLCVLAI